MTKITKKIKQGLVGLATAITILNPIRAEEPLGGLAKAIQESGIEFLDKSGVKLSPEKVPGAGVIEDYNVEGAKYQLVHIRQRHKSPDEKEQNSEKDIRETVPCQKDIYQIILELNSRGVKEVYLEGLFEENEKGVNDYLQDNIGKEVKRLSEVVESSEYQKWYKEVEGKIRLIASENQFIRERGGDFEKKEREEYLLKKIVEDSKKSPKQGTQRIAVVVYGAGHEFLDNIQEWNKSHQDEKFSLKTITPAYINETEGHERELWFSKLPSERPRYFNR